MKPVLPDLYRYSRIEFQRKRLLFTLALASVVGATFFWAYWMADALFWPKKSYEILRTIELTALLVMGSVGIFGSIYGEKISGTWDLLRLSPLKSSEVALGKLLGAPLMAFLLGAALLPWLVFSAMAGGASASELGGDVLQILILTLSLYCLALLLSSHSYLKTKGQTAQLNSAFGALIGLAGLVFANSILSSQKSSVLYFHQEINGRFVLVALTAYFGLWAFFAAKWRIGRDFAEPGRWWRVIAFQCLTAVVLSGFEQSSAASLFLLFPAFGSLLAEKDNELWLRWVRQPLHLAKVPVWLLAYGGGAVACLLFYFSRAWQGDPGAGGFFRYLPVAWLYFGRDLAIIQHMKSRASKYPEFASVAIVTLLYFIPLFFTTLPQLKGYRDLVLPIPGGGDRYSLPVAYLSAGFQAALAGWILWRHSKRVEIPSALP
jgi:hypothetical protein